MADFFEQPNGYPMRLSVILPFYRKLAEFRRVLPLNAGYLAKPGIEVIVVMDDNVDEGGLMELVGDFPAIRWKIIVNDEAHAWRPPCIAINVGIRHCVGKTVLVCSPESAFATDVPGHAILLGHVQPDAVGVGRVTFASFADVRPGQSLLQLHALGSTQVPFLFSFYGSLIAPRAALEAVRGYDESLAQWGGDDDNIRIRLESAGYALYACPEVQLVHLSFAARTGSEQYDDLHAWQACTPPGHVANEGVEWGNSFSRLAFESHGTVSEQPIASSELAGTLLPYRSRRRCDICGRYVHYERAPDHCARCSQIGQPAARSQPPPQLLCVLQVRNESRYLPGCLDHLRASVDGFVALDDGSTDDTPEILRHEPKLLNLLTNPVSADHRWDERANKLRLLESAREHGADWVLVCDADERYEQLFLAHLRHIIASLSSLSLPSVIVMYRELWDAPMQYRVDGPWGRKTRTRLFRLPSRIAFEESSDLHGTWCPDENARTGQAIGTGYHLYHLGSLRAPDRIARRDRYKRLDPQGQHQPQGYDYLAEQSATTRLTPIMASRIYDYTTLPPDLRTMRSM